jgi:hypothetical protein
LRSVLLFTFASLALFAEHASAVAGDDLLHALKPVTDAILAKPGPEDWLMSRGDYRAWGYSALDQITAHNVGRLQLAWAWNMEPGYQEEAPLAHDGVVFLANPKNVVQALDGRTGDLLWEYRRELPRIEGGYTMIFLIGRAAPSRFMPSDQRSGSLADQKGWSDIGYARSRRDHKNRARRRLVEQHQQAAEEYGLGAPRASSRLSRRDPTS